MSSTIIAKGHKSRQNILKQTLKLFSSKGYFATSIQEIADKSHVSQTNIIYHFQSKERLYIALLDQIIENNKKYVLANMSKSADPLDKLMAHFYGNLNWALESKEEAKLILLLYYHASFQKKFTKLYSEIKSQAQEKIEMLLNDIQIKNKSLLLSNKQLASFLHDMLLGRIVNTITTSQPDIHTIVDDWAKLFQKILL